MWRPESVGQRAEVGQSARDMVQAAGAEMAAIEQPEWLECRNYGQGADSNQGIRNWSVGLAIGVKCVWPE